MPCAVSHRNDNKFLAIDNIQDLIDAEESPTNFLPTSAARYAIACRNGNWATVSIFSSMRSSHLIALAGESAAMKSLIDARFFFASAVSRTLRRMSRTKLLHRLIQRLSATGVEIL